MIPIIAVSFAVLLLLGIPVAFVIGVAGFIGLWWSGEYPLTVIVKQIFEGVDSFVLREPDQSDQPFEGRLIMEFFETDEFGGQTDNWVAPSAPCLAPRCSTSTTGPRHPRRSTSKLSLG